MPISLLWNTIQHTNYYLLKFWYSVWMMKYFNCIYIVYYYVAILIKSYAKNEFISCIWFHGGLFNTLFYQILLNLLLIITLYLIIDPPNCLSKINQSWRCAKWNSDPFGIRRWITRRIWICSDERFWRFCPPKKKKQESWTTQKKKKTVS